MPASAYRYVSGAFFVLVALGHAWRASQSLPVAVGALAVPVWMSWAATAFAALMAVWAFRARA